MMVTHPDIDIRGTEHPCHACDQPAVQQWERDATPDETSRYHANMDAWRTSQGLEPMPETAAIRNAPVQIAVYGCDEHGPIVE